jgi:hypothetical protein
MTHMTRRALTALLTLGLLGSLACKPTEPPADKPAEAATEKPADKPAEKPADKPAAPAANNAPAADKPAAPAANNAVAAEGGTTEDDGQGGRWVKSSLYGVKFRVPDTWEVSIDAQGITVNDEDKTTTVVLVGSESTSLIQGALNDIKKKIALKDAKLAKTDMVVINGLAGQTVRGSAIVEKGNAAANADQDIEFIAYNLSVGKKAVTMMIFSQAEMYEAKKEIIEGIGQTMTKN